MKKSDIIDIINDSIEAKKLCRIGYQYDDVLKFCFPLLISDGLYLSSIEGNFEFCGYHIGMISNIYMADTKTKGDRIFDIIEAEGISKYMNVPDIDISDWKSVFESLKKYDRYIIVKNEKDYDSSFFLVTGKIVKVTSKYVVMQIFDCDGEWDERLHQIPFSKITSVEFDTRYCNVFSKYI